MKRRHITAAFMALVMILILGAVSGCAGTGPVRRVPPGSEPGRPSSRQGSSRAGGRYALVIGNAAYRNIERLENTVNDARDISEALEELGFEVDMRLDTTEAQFDAAINAYIAKLAADSGSEGFFWYAGHGVQIRDQNYLLPVDAGIESESALQRHSFSLDKLLSDLEGARNRVNVVILDACRNNPLPSSSRGAGSRGLAVIQDVPGDLFMMFSTAAGDVAADGKGKRNSPFAEAFLKYIASSEAVAMMASDVINETMRLTSHQQRPFSRGSIISDKYYSLNPGRSGGGGGGGGAGGSVGGGEDPALVFYKEGISLFSNGETGRAIVYFTEAIRLNLKTPEVYAQRGEAYRMQGDYDRGIADCTEALRLNPAYTWAYAVRGNGYNNKGDYDRGIADFTEVIRQDPTYAFAYANRGHGYNMKGDYNRAIPDLTEAIRLDPGYAWAYAERGQAYKNKGDYDRGITDLTEAIRLDPAYAWAYGERGQAYKNKGDYDRGITDLTEAIRLNPAYTWAYGERGQIYKNKGDYDRAITDLTEALRLNPGYLWAYAERGQVYNNKGDYDRAITDLTEALRLDPAYAWAYGERGAAYENKKDYDRAIADFTEAVRIDPNYEWAKNRLEIVRKRGQ
jgi:tetratricopeptide (TPR) repeat protein